jgi:hypothetical protein
MVPKTPVLKPEDISFKDENKCKYSPKRHVSLSDGTEAVTLLTSIREVTGSNLDWNMGVPDRCFVVFLSLSKQMSG